MEIYTIGFAKKKAEQFFEILKKYRIKRLIDIRLNNTSQLAGYSKREDLQYFLKELCGVYYIYQPLLAPTPEMLTSYKKKMIDWYEYEKRFLDLMAQRKIEEKIDLNLFIDPTVFLCSEPKADKCHRRLVAEYLKSKWGEIEIRHL